MSKAAIYVRVSTGQQAEEGHSLVNQKDACAKYAKENSLQVVKTYEDAGVSGTTDDRPAMQRALKETHGFEHLVIYDSTRLGRETNVNQTLRRIFFQGQRTDTSGLRRRGIRSKYRFRGLYDRDYGRSG